MQLPGFAITEHILKSMMSVSSIGSFNVAALDVQIMMRLLNG